MRKIRDFFRWFITVCSYARFLWNYGGDYDYMYLLHLLRFKIRRMRKHMLDHHILLHTEKYAKQMRIAELLLTRIIEDNYYANEDAALVEKYGELTTAWDKKYAIFTHKKCTTEEQEAAAHLARIELSKRQEMAKTRDYIYLFQYLCRHIHRWWD